MARRRLTPAQPGHSGSASVVPIAGSASIPPIAQVSGQSAEAAALREITEDLQAARDEGRMVLELPLGEVSSGYLVRDRVALDPEEIEALKASIRAHGQRQPAEVTPLSDPQEGARYGLISGWRRLQALRALHEETGDPAFASLRALVRPPEEASASYVAMVEENEIRVGLSYYERARVVSEAVGQGVFDDISSALRSLFATASRAKRSKIASFIDIHEALGDVLRFPADIPERLGLAVVSQLRQGGRVPIRAALSQAQPDTARAELAVLESLLRPAKADVSRAKHSREALRDDVDLSLKHSGGRITATFSGAGVDAALLEDIRQLLARLGTQGNR